MATITSGGVAQNALASNPNRQGYRIQNQSTADLYFNETATATIADTSVKLIAGAYFETPINYHPKGAISVIGATTGQAFNAAEY